VFGSLVLIAVVVGASAAAFTYTAGLFSPQRLTPDKMVDAFMPPTSVKPLGHRKNHAKGICFTGIFESNGAGSALSQAQVFTRGQYPALGRFNLATANPNAPDATVRVRGLGLRISTPDGQEWRSAMIDAPFFAVSTPQVFYELLLAEASKDPNAMPARIPRSPRSAHGPRTLPGQAATRRSGSKQPRQLYLRRQFRRGARGAMVAPAGGATSLGLAR
jgi:catalase